MRDSSDIAILGSGPAAAAIAGECCRAGAAVTLIAPAPEARWEPSYCLWEDEVPQELRDSLEHRWPEVRVASPGRERTLPRAYAKLDNDAVQARFHAELSRGGARVVSAHAIGIEETPGAALVHTEDGGVERARVVVDASGARSSFVARVHKRPSAYQMAYGLLLHAPGHGFSPSCATLMDFRPAASDAAEPPSFLYMLPFSDERVFVEETSLARRPAVSFELLGARLERRLSNLGLERAERIGVERCAIPMGLALPARGQPLIPFGAAASMVHPASGYSIAHALWKAPIVAAAIVEALQSEGPTQAIAAGNAAVWPHAQRSAWELYTFGLETLLSMGGVETGRFFSEFFELPTDAWSGYLSGQLPPAELVAVMTRLFRRLPAPIRWHLVRTGMSAGAAPLARTVLQAGLT